MKKNMISFRRPMFFSLLLIAFVQSGCSQNSPKQAFRAYHQIDTTTYASSKLFLYTDNTFINYGTFKEENNGEVRVWYTCGKWEIKNGEIVCNTASNKFDQAQLLNTIKSSLIQNGDSSLSGESKIVNEKYTNHTFVIIKNKLYDVNKKIGYLNLQSKASPMFMN